MKTPEYEYEFKTRWYGRKAYTWAFVKQFGDWISLGDPWPSAKWPKKALSHWTILTLSPTLVLNVIESGKLES